MPSMYGPRPLFPGLYGDEENDPTTWATGGTTGGNLLGASSGGSPGMDLGGKIAAGWKGLTGYLGGSINGEAGDGDNLLGYKPVSRMDAIAKTLLGASKGVLSQRGPYANPLGGGLLGASEGLDTARAEDTQRRQSAVSDQYKKMGMTLQAAKAAAEAAKANAPQKYSPGEVGIDPTTHEIIATGGPRLEVVNGHVLSIPSGQGGPVGELAYAKPAATSLEQFALGELPGAQGGLVLPGQGGGPPGAGGPGAPGAPGAFPGTAGAGIDHAAAGQILQNLIAKQNPATISGADQQRIALERQQMAEAARHNRAGEANALTGFETDQQRIALERQRMAEAARHNLAGEGIAAKTAAAGGGEKSQPERDRQRLLTLGQKVAAGQASPDETAYYDRLYRETSAPQLHLDPVSGTMVKQQPDVSDLALPPSMRPPSQLGAPAAGPPGMGTPPQPGVTTTNIAAPAKAADEARTAYGHYQKTTETLSRVQDLLKNSSTNERLYGDKASRINLEGQQLISAMGELANAGVMQPSDLQRYSAALGNLTGPAAAAASATGMDTSTAALEEMRQMLDRGMGSKAVHVSDAAARDALPAGTPYVAPDGKIRVKR